MKTPHAGHNAGDNAGDRQRTVPQKPMFVTCLVRGNSSAKRNVHNCNAYLKGHNTQHSGHTVFFQNKLMVEIYPKCLLRAIGKVLLMKFS